MPEHRIASEHRIVLVANTSWSIFHFRLYLIKQLIEQGYSIHILAPRDAYTARFENLPGLAYIELKKFRGKSISPFSDIGLYRELLGHYRRIRPDLIFHYTIKANIFGSLAAARVKIPSVSVITGLGYVFAGDGPGNGLIKTAAKLLYRRALQKNVEVWFLNPDDQEVFIKEKLAKKEKTFILPGEGVDMEVFYPDPYEAGERTSQSDDGSFKPAGAPIRFLLIGRLIKHKGILEYIRAAELMQSRGLSVKFALLGFFDEANPVAIPKWQLEEWVRKGIIEYLGSTDNVVPFIAQSDCIVLPSYREGMPLSLLEGASMCKALIAADTAGCREIIRDNTNGYLCQPKDGEDLAIKMEKYARLSPANKRQMGMLGRDRVIAQFRKELVVNIYREKLKQLIT
jgi:glycosyltransferase involved in cell wall biosynthesis